jgi:osmotically-inducible protein OsmY
MKKVLTIAMLSLTLLGCDNRKDEPKAPQDRVTYDASREDSDNTGRNVRDRDERARTPLDQSESEADRTLTQKIRRAIMNDDSLSTNAKNIKVISINGVVTLRGPVANSREKEIISRKVKDVQGILRVDNQLEVIQRTH